MARINLQLRQFVIVPLNVKVVFYAYFRQPPPPPMLSCSLSFFLSRASHISLPLLHLDLSITPQIPFTTSPKI
jgi:hypothetical protein